MFDHLDDPNGFEPNSEFRNSVHRRGTILRRRHRVALLSTTVVGCLLLAVGGIAIAADRRLDDVGRVEIGPADQGADAFEEPFNVLVVGTDEKPEVEGVRSDTVMVVRIDPATSRAVALPLPRDLYVPIADTGTEGRLNEAIAGGPARLVETVEALGVPVDHYLAVDFEGMQAMVDAVGGVDVNFPEPVRDRSTGLSVTDPGCVRLDGRSALALVRSRHFEQFRAGGWSVDQRGDLGRIERQLLFGRIVLGVFGQLGDDASELERVTRVLASNVTVDDEMSNADLLKLARVVHRITPDSVFELSLPVETVELDSGAVVLKLSGGSGEQLQDMDGGRDSTYFGPSPETGVVTTKPPDPSVPPTIGPC